MINAYLHYDDGRTLEEVIPNMDRFKCRHLGEMLNGKTIIEHQFEYRVGQPEYLVSVHFDEVAECKPVGRGAFSHH